MTAIDRVAISDRLNHHHEYNSGYANQILNVTGAAADAVISANRSSKSNIADDNFQHSIGHPSDDDDDAKDLDDHTNVHHKGIVQPGQKSYHSKDPISTYADTIKNTDQDQENNPSNLPIDTVKLSNNLKIQQGEHETGIEVGTFESKLISRSLKLNDREQKLKANFMKSQGNRNKPVKRVLQPKLIKNNINSDYQHSPHQSKESSITSTAAAAAAAAAVAVANASPVLKIKETLENKLNELNSRLQVIDSNIDKSNSYRRQENMSEIQNHLQGQIQSLINQLRSVRERQDGNSSVNNNGILEKGHLVSTSNVSSPNDGGNDTPIQTNTVGTKLSRYGQDLSNFTRHTIMPNTDRLDMTYEAKGKVPKSEKFIGPRKNPPKPIAKEPSRQSTNDRYQQKRGELLAEILSSESSPPSSVNLDHQLTNSLPRNQIKSVARSTSNDPVVKIKHDQNVNLLDSYMLPRLRPRNAKQNILNELSNQQAWDGLAKAENELKEIMLTSNNIENNLEIVSQTSRHRNGIFSNIENMKTFQDISVRRIKMEISNRITDVRGEIESDVVTALSKSASSQDRSDNIIQKVEDYGKTDMIKGHRRFLKSKKESNRKLTSDKNVGKASKPKQNTSNDVEIISLKKRARPRVRFEGQFHPIDNSASKFNLDKYNKTEPSHQRIDHLPTSISRVIPLGYPIISNSTVVENTDKPVKSKQSEEKLQIQETDDSKSRDRNEVENTKIDINVEERQNSSVNEQGTDKVENNDAIDKGRLERIMSYEDDISSSSCSTGENVIGGDRSDDEKLANTVSLSLQGVKHDQTAKASNKDIERPKSQYISDRYFGQTNILESEQQLQLLIRNNITDWVEQELLARIVSEAGNTHCANNNSDIESSNQTEESSRNSEAEFLNQVGSRGLQFLIDAGCTPNREEMENLVSEVLTDKLRNQMAGPQLEASEHDLILEKSISTPQPTPPESDSDHANDVIQASNVYTPQRSSSSSSESSEPSRELIVKDEDSADDKYGIDEENAVEKVPQNLEDLEFQKPDLDTPDVSPATTPLPEETETVHVATPILSESDNESLNIIIEDPPLSSEASQSEDDINQNTVIAVDNYNLTTQGYTDNGTASLKLEVDVPFSEKQMIQGVEKKVVIKPRPIGFFSASAEVVNDDELSVIQELQHSDVSDKEIEDDEGKLSPKTTSISSSIVTTNDTYGDGISEGELLTNESAAYVESRSEGEFVQKSQPQTDKQPLVVTPYKAGKLISAGTPDTKSRMLIEAILDDDLPTDSGSSDTIMDNTLSEINPLPDDNCSSEGEILPNMERANMNLSEFDDDPSEGQLSAGQVNIRKIETVLSNTSKEKSSDQLTDSNGSGHSIARGIRHVMPVTTDEKVQASSELKLHEELDTDVSDSRPSSPLVLQQYSPASEETDDKAIEMREGDTNSKLPGRTLLRSEQIEEKEEEISVISMDDIESLST